MVWISSAVTTTSARHPPWRAPSWSWMRAGPFCRCLIRPGKGCTRSARAAGALRSCRARSSRTGPPTCPTETPYSRRGQNPGGMPARRVGHRGAYDALREDVELGKELEDRYVERLRRYGISTEASRQGLRILEAYRKGFV